MGAIFPRISLCSQQGRSSGDINRPKIFLWTACLTERSRELEGPRIQPFSNLHRHHSASFMACLKVTLGSLPCPLSTSLETQS